MTQIPILAEAILVEPGTSNLAISFNNYSCGPCGRVTLVVFVNRSYYNFTACSAIFLIPLQILHKKTPNHPVRSVY